MREESDDTSEEEEPEPHDNEEGAELEDWVDYIKRVTCVAEDCLGNAKREDWVAAQRRRKWRWAGHVARRWDDRWSHKVLQANGMGGVRRVAHPVARWRDSIESFVSTNTEFTSTSWITLAQNRDAWHTLEDKFVQWSC